MREEVVRFGSGDRFVGVLSRPDVPVPQRPAALLINAGLLHRVGPNRLYVKLARTLAASGHTVLRFDLSGIGDTGLDDRALAAERAFLEDTREAIDFAKEASGNASVMLMGICMGAQVALEIARSDPRVSEVVLMEGVYVKGLRYHARRALDPGKWRRVVTGESHMVKALRRRVARKLRRGGAARQDAPKPKLSVWTDQLRSKDKRRVLRELLDRGCRVFMIFRQGNEIEYNYRLGRAEGGIVRAHGLPKGLDVAFVRFADHTFTPAVSQRYLIDAVRGWCAPAPEQEALPLSALGAESPAV